MFRANGFMSMVASFILGAVSAMMLRNYMFPRLIAYDKIEENEKEEERMDDISLEHDEQRKELMNTLRGSIIHLSSRIGELPSRTRKSMRWPWDKMPRRGIEKEEDKEEELNLKSKMSDDSSWVIDGDSLSDTSSGEEENGGKSGHCIGSIFGLDVGGSLAKLVYFDVQRNGLEGSESHSSSLLGGAGKLHEKLPIHRFLSMSQDNRYNDSDAGEYSNGTPCRDYIQKELSAHFSPDLPEPPLTGLKKSITMVDLSKAKSFVQALDGFYDFARHLDTFGESGVKEKQLSFYSRELQGEFHFIHFETRRMHSATQLIKANNLHLNIVEMGATGGGAHKYASHWDSMLGIQMKKHDELDCLVVGMQFVIADVVGECYTFKPADENSSYKIPKASPSSDPNKHADESFTRKVVRDMTSQTYPYLIVTIGTGVSILRVDGRRKFERISGSSIGGGTYWGLCRLLTDVQDFEDALNIAAKGDPFNVDMSVGDIYGTNSDALEKVGLPAYIVASSFGKLVAKHNPASGVRQEDLARALLIMVTNNIAQIAYLNAILQNTSRIYFVGNFLRHNDISQRRLAYAIDFWSQGKMEALFLTHEGYFGALGAFLLNNQAITNKHARKTTHNETKSTVTSNGMFKSESSREIPTQDHMHKLRPSRKIKRSHSS